MFFFQGACVAFKHLKLVNVPCDNSLGYYFDYNTDGDPTTATKPLLGYLCETRQTLLLSGTDMCYFPFVFQGITYTSCSLVNNSLLNNHGAPWCATEVTFSAFMQAQGFLKIFDLQITSSLPQT